MHLNSLNCVECDVNISTTGRTVASHLKSFKEIKIKKALVRKQL